MSPVEWFIVTLGNEFSVRVKQEDVSYETTKLYVDEVDTRLLPRQLMVGLPEDLLFETMVYHDGSDIEWLGVLGVDQDLGTKYIEIIVKNGELVRQERCN